MSLTSIGGKKSSCRMSASCELSTEQELYERWVGRENQLATLLHLIGGRYCSQKGMLVFGPAAGGKTSVVIDVLKHRGAAYAVVDSNCYVKDRELLSSILLQLGIRDEQEQNASTSEAKDVQPPDSSRPSRKRKSTAPIGASLISWEERMTDFSGKLNSFLSLTEHTLFFVIKGFERVSAAYPSLIPSLLRLPEAAQRSVCVILIGRQFSSDPQLAVGVHLFPVHFPAYNSLELRRILKRTFATVVWQQKGRSDTITPENAEEHVVDAFVRYCVDTISRHTRDLREAQHVVRSLWGPFVRGLEVARRQMEEVTKRREERKESKRAKSKKSQQKSEQKIDDAATVAAGSSSGFTPAVVSASLTSLQSPTRQLLQALYRHEQAIADADQSPATHNSSHNLVSLPVSARFLVVAGFLASFNHPTQDRQLFGSVAARHKRRKAKKTSIHDHTDDTPKKTKQSISLVLLGPKPFPLDRMLAIFNVIHPDNPGRHLEPHAQVAHLISMKVFTNLTSISYKSERGALEDVKLVCNVTLDDANTVADSIALDLRQFLFDPSTQQGAK